MNKWTGALQIAAVYVGTVIGAGFATGKEIVEFFTQYGLYGLVSILIAGYLFIFFGMKVMIKSIDIQAASFMDLNNDLFGQHLGKVMNIFMTLMLVGVCGVMLSGAEALFSEQLGWDRAFGSVMTIILCLAVLWGGVKGLFAVNTFVVPILILFNFLLMFHSLSDPSLWVNLLYVPDFSNVWKSIGSAFSYAAFNLTLAQAVLVPIATEINDKTMIKLGGFIGGLLLTIILISSHIILSTLPNLLAYDIPMATIVKNSISGIYFIYLFIIYGEIFTSLIGNMYGIERQISYFVHFKQIWIHIVVIFVVYMIGRMEYGQLLGLLYPLFGYISLIFLLLLWIKPLIEKK
ncbi:hypothetical protein MUB24_12585 [Lederbergia sp. NSJ-179]|uniref:YkvI family membrane protein n=1 Tax=Lederbergia sp. NSJ-179 TaxID=2931402 RepID=UPI001FCF9B98|nr:hypothetical protein [Lederbergia sp. NSJ-179]MCJ7841718.1 hypothetical protein [Lederbergia sp. NSJ-179]